MDPLRNLKNVLKQNEPKKDNYIKSDALSCKEIVAKIDKALNKPEEFTHFNNMYTNFNCMEFELLQQKYKEIGDFNIKPFPNYPSVSNMKIVYNPKTDKLDINLI
jgi:hypothetical protein